ncbi:MAG: exonuclease domain-containing protein [Patescibacteria group bacterium]
MELIVLDTETTGVNAKEDSLIEIAAARVVDGQVVDRFQTMVKPVKTPLNTTVSVLTGIKPEDLVNAPDISDIKDKLLEFVGELPITGHNISFDLDFLKANGIDPLGHSLDTLDLVIAVLPKLPYHSMQFLAQYFQLPAKPSHRAMDDVLATADLVNVIISYVQNLPEPILKNIKEVLAKSDWEWSWVFDTPDWHTTIPLPDFSRHSGEAPLGLTPESYSNLYDPRRGEDNDARKTSSFIRSWTSQDDVIEKIKTGLNLFELPPDIPQIPANIALAANDKQSVLVVSNNTFNQTDWVQHKLNPQFGSTVQLDADRFKFLLDKPKLKSPDAKLLIKVFLTGYPQKPLNPDQIYLSRDEYYLWEQKLAPLKAVIDKLPDQVVCNFSTLWEILESNPDLLKNRTIYLPQWLEFTDWALFKSVRIFTELYLNAAVSSRRDYVHDFINDNKIADEMFKLLNNFGTQINSLWSAVGNLWQTTGGDKTIEINGLFTTTKAGKEVAKFAGQAEQTLNKFLEKVEFTPEHSARVRQIEHTKKLLEHLQALSGETEHEVYLTGYLDRVTMYVARLPLTNIWQTPPTPPLSKGGKGGVGLKDLRIAIVSNSLLVSGAEDFMTNIFGEPVITQTLSAISSEPPLRHPGLVQDRIIDSLAASRGNGQAGSLAQKNKIPGPAGPEPSLRGRSPSGAEPGRKQARNDDDKKPIKVVKSLPDRKAPDYEDKVFNYLRQNLQPTEKNLVVFSNNPQVGIFFEKYYQQIPGVDVVSYNVAGNSEMLADKLAQKSGFTLLVSNSNLVKYLKSVETLDRVIFLTMPFDPPGTLGQILATTKLRNDFTDYALPRAVLKFKQALADLHGKTNEFLILDSRLVNADWASPILSSLSNFSIEEI